MRSRHLRAIYYSALMTLLRGRRNDQNVPSVVPHLPYARYVRILIELLASLLEDETGYSDVKYVLRPNFVE